MVAIPRLNPCDLKVCEAMCCHDGVYLMPEEERFLLDLVERVPYLKALLPDIFILDGFWQGEYYGRKTATRAHTYRNPDYPEHFPRTRCVFADADGLCELEKFARQRNQHPWTFKPASCWMFPLGLENGEAVPPPVDPLLDPYRSEGYPGFATVVPCGRHDPKGLPWRRALKNELKYLKHASGLPILGSAGHSVDELLGGAGTGKDDSEASPSPKCDE